MSETMREAQSVSRRQAAHERRGLAIPILFFVAILALHGAVTAAILMSEGMVLIALIPLSGLLVILLFVIGHDACHQSFTSSGPINDCIGRIAFLPSLHAFSLWDREHNRRHHRYNNIRGMDYAWVPWSPQEFAQATPFGRLKYRFYRDPGGVFFYYLFEIWAQRKIFPRRSMVGKLQVAYFLDTALVWIFSIVYATSLAHFGARFGRTAFESISLAFVLPFLIFSTLISIAIYLHHTHYQVPWYNDVAQWKRENGAIHGTVHVRFPWLARKLILHIMEHTAHHVAPRVPLYRLEPVQEEISRCGPVTWQFSVAEYFRVCGRCKLFDYDRGSWADFSGNATSNPLFDLQIEQRP
jgi:omega-6 fatty acid desaturase (delta-12 desaturase)